MIRSILLLAALLGLSSVSMAQEIAVPMKASLFAGSTKTFVFTFAADRTATDTIDKHLGEFEIPPIPPPGDIFYVWTIAPMDEVVWISPMDVREYKIGEPSIVEYDVQVNWSGGRLEFSWGSTPLPPQIDSMYLVDGYTEFPDNILKVKVGPGAKLETNNPAFELFKVLVWFNGTTTSVQEASPLAQAGLYPNPVSSDVTITGLPETPVEVQIISSQGHVLQRCTVSEPSCTLPVSNLAPGMYGARIVDPNGSRVIPFIRR